MKIFIDIGHPAHVHYFKNLINILKGKGHSFLITSRDKDIAHELLNDLGLKYINRGKGGQNPLSKILYMIKADFEIYKLSRKFKPDLFLNFGSPYPPQVAWLTNNTSVIIDDTDSATLNHFFYKFFATHILSPSCFNINFGKKHTFFDSYMELCYLHPNYFSPNPEILKDLGVLKNEKYVILRFVSWNASHDIGHSGIFLENKIKAVKEFSKYAKVFISSESALPPELEDYKINISSSNIHHALAFASLFYGESATMASESAVLGTPAIFLDNDGRGYTKEQEEKYKLVYNFTESVEDQLQSIQKGVEILKGNSDKSKFIERKDNLLTEKIDLTEYLIGFIEKIAKENNTL